MGLGDCEYCWDYCGGQCDDARARQGFRPLGDIAADAERYVKLKEALEDAIAQQKKKLSSAVDFRARMVVYAMRALESVLSTVETCPDCKQSGPLYEGAPHDHVCHCGRELKL